MICIRAYRFPPKGNFHHESAEEAPHAELLLGVLGVLGLGRANHAEDSLRTRFVRQFVPVPLRRSSPGPNP